MSDPIKAWMCIGCGSIEAPQTCIGICQHRKVEFVHAFEHATALAELAGVREDRTSLEALVRRMAQVTPREDACAATLRAFRQDARDLLARLRTRAAGRDTIVAG
jgi:hypothetical protein